MRFLITAVLLCIALLSMAGCDTERSHHLIPNLGVVDAVDVVENPSVTTPWTMVQVYHVGPEDSEPAVSTQDIVGWMQKTQNLFADGMERHGFERKTFKMRRHQDGKIVKRLFVRNESEIQEKSGSPHYDRSLNVIFFDAEVESQDYLSGAYFIDFIDEDFDVVEVNIPSVTDYRDALPHILEVHGDEMPNIPSVVFTSHINMIETIAWAMGMDFGLKPFALCADAVDFSCAIERHKAIMSGEMIESIMDGGSSYNFNIKSISFDEAKLLDTHRAFFVTD